MFRGDNEFVPRTYAIRGYCSRKRFSFFKLFLYLGYSVVFVCILAIALLSATNII